MVECKIIHKSKPSGSRVKMSATIVAWQRKIWLIYDSKSHIWNSLFWKYFFVFRKIYSSTRFSGQYQSFFLFFWFTSRNPQNQQKLVKKITHFTIQFCSKNLTHFKNLNSLDNENNMLSQCSQKPFSLYKFSSHNFSVLV